MRKTLFAIGLTTFLLAGCAQSAAEVSSNQDVSQETLDQQSEQLKDYEAKIAEQEKQIKELTEEIASLKETSDNTEEGSSEQVNVEDYIVLFKGEDTASYVLPTIEPYNKEEDLVKVIHNFVSKGYDIGLNSYRFEDNNKLLVLDYDENANNVQGSAGAHIFLEAMTNSYFANFPELIGIKLLLNGNGTAAVIGEYGTNEIFVREPLTYEPDLEW